MVYNLSCFFNQQRLKKHEEFREKDSQLFPRVKYNIQIDEQNWPSRHQQETQELSITKALKTTTIVFDPAFSAANKQVRGMQNIYY